ncbi:MAG: DUF5985 family protein [Candidatus Korobacteraceae bacterium]
MGPAVYIFGLLVTLSCGVLLTRAYTNVGKRLLLWSAICFYFLAVSNLIVFLDLIVFPAVDLYRWRLITAAVGMLILLYGLIWEGDK